MQYKYFNINAQGCSIRCKLYFEDPDRVKTAVLFCHGFGGHKDNRAAERLAGRILEKNRGTALLIFNWPCHGDDVRKTLRLADCERYLEIVLAWLGERYPQAVLCACATSFGGYLLMRWLSCHENPFRRIALRCPAVNMYEVLTGRIMGEEERRRIARGKSVMVGFDRKVTVDAAFLESLRENDLRKMDFLPLAEDVLILHGTKDEIVPFSESEAFAEQNLIEFVPVEGADHRFQDPAKMDLVIAGFLAFFGLR